MASPRATGPDSQIFYRLGTQFGAGREGACRGQNEKDGTPDLQECRNCLLAAPGGEALGHPVAVFKTAALNRSATHPVSPGSAHYHAHPKNEKRAHPAAAKRVCQRPVYAKRATPSARSIATCASAG